MIVALVYSMSLVSNISNKLSLKTELWLFLCYENFLLVQNFCFKLVYDAHTCIQCDIVAHYLFQCTVLNCSCLVASDISEYNWFVFIVWVE